MAFKRSAVRSRISPVRDPTETQRSGFGWKRRSNEVSELSPRLAEAREMEFVLTRACSSAG